MASNKKGTAKIAADFLSKKGFIIPTSEQRENIAIAFAKRGLTVHRNAFDLVKSKGKIDLSDLEEVTDRFLDFTLYELKSTDRKNLDSNFKNYFFDLTTTEFLTAQSLGKSYRFVFVNIITKAVLEMTINELMSKAAKIYPKWAIRF